MLNKLPKTKLKSKSKQVGRGYGSGKGGHTVGRGQKGQKSRSGYSRPRKFFEGGSNPLTKRLPKLKGFSRGSITSKYIEIKLNLNDLNQLENDTELSMESFKELGFSISNSKPVRVKILGNGSLDKKLVIKSIPCSENAKEAIEKAGGKVL